MAQTKRKWLIFFQVSCYSQEFIGGLRFCKNFFFKKGYVVKSIIY